VVRLTRRWTLRLAAALIGAVASLGVAAPGHATPACSLIYQVNASWGGPVPGFQAQINLRNTGTTPTTSWRVTLTMPDGVRIVYPHGGIRFTVLPPSTYLFDNQPWNAVLPPNTGVWFGFTATKASPDLPNTPVRVTCAVT